MTTLIIICLVIVGLAVVAVAYVYGFSNGYASAEPEKCRDKIREAEDRQRAAETTARMWREQAIQSEEKRRQLDRDVTITGEFLIAEIDKAMAAAATRQVSA